MKTVWKWIIGIVAALVIIAVIVGGVWLVAARVVGAARYSQVAPRTPVSPLPNGNNGPYGYRGGPGWMMPYGHGYHMMGGYGFGFGIIPAIIGFLFFLGIAALVVLGIIWLVRSLSRRPVMPAVPPASTTSASAVTTHSCANCGQPVQNGFAYCPNCGAKQ